MSVAQVYKSISKVAADLASSGVPKERNNVDEGYQYRSIDDVTHRVAPLLAKRRLCILPRVLDRIAEERVEVGGGLLVAVTLRVAFDIISAADGSCHTVETFGEALDSGDKATAKAMTAAYKTALLESFCVPVRGSEDADRKTHKLAPYAPLPSPAEGWEAWAEALVEMIEGCASAEGVRRLQERQRSLLTSLSRVRPELYSALGATFLARTRLLTASEREPIHATGEMVAFNGSEQKLDLERVARA